MSEKSDKLKAYLEEIGHYISGREEREEILSEIRSHILERAEAEQAETGGGALGAPGSLDASDALARVIAGYGPARKVAEKYLEGRPIIAPVYKRYLFRYTTLIFAFHALLALVAFVFKKEFAVFPLLFIPSLGLIEFLMYLPTAFLADLGLVALVLYFVTRSGKDVRLPWPKFAADLADLDEAQKAKTPIKSRWPRLIGTAIGAVIMLALTDIALYVFARHETIFFVNLDRNNPQPLFEAAAGRRLSLIVIAFFGTSAITLFTKLFTRSRWVDVASNAISLALIGLLLGQSFEGLFAVAVPGHILRWAKISAVLTLLVIALIVAAELIRDLVVIGRRNLIKGGRHT